MDATEPKIIRRVDHAVSLRDEVEAMLSTAIVSGELASGTLVSVPALAAQFAVSATPVREAMVNLQERGFVSPVRNKGFRVTAVSERDVREIVTIRAMLEAPAMREVARAFPRERISEFRDLAESIVRAVDASDLGDYLRADADFHRELLVIYGNRRLIEVVTALRQQTRMVGQLSLLGTPGLRRAASEHHRILDLMMDGDFEAVEELTRNHILRALPAQPEIAGGP